MDDRPENRQGPLTFLMVSLSIFIVTCLLLYWPLIVNGAHTILLAINVLSIIGIILAVRWLRNKWQESQAAKQYRNKMAALAMSEREAHVAQEWMRVGVVTYPKNNVVFSRTMPGGPIQQIYSSSQPAQLPSPEEEENDLTIPDAPPWRDVKQLIENEHHIILGWQDGPVYGSIKDLLSTGVIGKPGRGKTTALLFYVAELLAVGATVMIMDPHGSLDNLRDVLMYATGEDIEKAIAQLEQDLTNRLDEYRHGKRAYTPYLCLIDEFASLTESFPRLRESVKRVILEGRKVAMYLIISSQAFMAKDFGGSTARDNLSSRIVFYSRDSQARILGLESEAIHTLLPALKGTIGRAILDCDSRDEPELIAIPLTTSDDIAEVTRRTGRSKPETFGNVSQNTANAGKNGIFIEPETFGDLAAAEIAIIKNMMHQQQSRRQIAEQLKRTGRGYQSLKAYFDQAGYKKDPLNS